VVRGREGGSANVRCLQGTGGSRSPTPTQRLLPPSSSLLSAPWRPPHPPGKTCGASSAPRSSCGWHSPRRHERTPRSSAEGPGRSKGQPFAQRTRPGFINKHAPLLPDGLPAGNSSPATLEKLGREEPDEVQ